MFDLMPIVLFVQYLAQSAPYQWALPAIAPYHPLTASPLAAPQLGATLYQTVTQVTVPTVTELLNNANPVVEWAGPVIVIALAIGLGFFAVRFVITRIQNALNNG